FSETPRTSNQQISLDEIGRDSFISWRQLQSEAIKSFNSLIEHMASTHITSLNLVTAISSTCNIARQRPEKMADVVSALEQLHLNLPPTLGTSQVKSVRKELKMHLLRMMKHPGSFTLHNLHARMKQLLIELGATPSEIQKAMPGPNEIDAALKRRLAAATAARKLQQTESGTDERPSRKKPHSGEKLSDSLQDEDLDLRDTKRLKLGEDEDYDDGTIDLYRQLDDPDSASAATQKAIDITTEFVLERLSISVVSYFKELFKNIEIRKENLVIISLYTLPDEMPPAFASSYTPIDEVGSEAQKRHLARMMAIQMTREGEGPGVEYIKAEKQKQFVEKQSAARSSEVIDKEKSNDETKKVIDEGTTSSLPPTTQKTRIQNWTLFNATRELFHKESEQLQLDIFQRILGNEKRAVQGGAGLAQQKLLIRLCTRFRSALTSELEATLLNYVIEEQKTRVDLALLHLAELYAQLMGYSTLVSPKAFNQLTNEEKKQRYDTYLCTLLSTLHERGEHKETLFHRIFLEAPFLTSGSLKILRKACLDKVYGAFAITTLRELILTRARQRQELLRLLIEFSYFERVDIREHCVKTIKELYQLDFLRSDVRGFLVEMSELLVAPTSPRVIWHANGRLARELEEIIDEMPWDESLIRAGLFLFLSLLPQEPSLLKQLASVYARAGTEIKRVTFRSIEQAIKAIGMHSEDLLDMIENCQPDAETLVARIVHLLTERNAPTPALVDRVRKLHQARNTDVRSLIPILNSLKKEELIELIPSFVLSAKNSNSVPVFFKKLLFGRHTDTNQAVLSPFELLLELHRLKANRKEQGFLMQNLDILLVDTAREFSFGKDVLAIAIETLINDKVFPVILFYTIQKVNEAQPTLNGFLTGLLEKIAQRKPWTEIEGDDTARETIWHKFEICSKALGSNRFPHLTLQPETNVDIPTAVFDKLESTEEKEKPMEEDKPLLNEQITMEN
uniref:Symplekin n=1 Tax=Meloidogyne floridensis TaxID=298350 RepID=A0A915P723_9BILA